MLSEHPAILGHSISIAKLAHQLLYRTFQKVRIKMFLKKRFSFMVKEQNQMTKPQNDEVIIAKNVGVYFDTSVSQDDYKSRLINIFKRKKKKKKQTKKIWPLKDINLTEHKEEK